MVRAVLFKFLMVTEPTNMKYGNIERARAGPRHQSIMRTERKIASTATKKMTRGCVGVIQASPKI